MTKCAVLLTLCVLTTALLRDTSSSMYLKPCVLCNMFSKKLGLQCLTSRAREVWKQIICSEVIKTGIH
ncbi:hypothetical protein LSAT2_008894 [Lamellibrachia satsuma]|nr:hypothetical protein LSAT2_008894 [Lamellibrachia satsuma]